MLRLVNLAIPLSLLFQSLLSLEHYAPSSHICSVCRCTLDSGTVKTLDCTASSLTEVLANWPPHGASLTAVFSKSNISTLQRLPASDARVDLVFDHCGIEKIDVEAFVNVVGVRVVDLSWNKISAEYLTPEVFKGPHNGTEVIPLELESLSLAYNDIHSLKNKLFQYTPRLKELNLEGNRFKVLDSHTQLALSSVTNLEVLNLANNELSGLEEGAFKTLQKLREIDLSSNNFNKIPTNLVYVSDSLEKLVINNNPIMDLDDESFLGLNNLVTLYLKNLTGLSWVKANTFSPLKKLKVLHLTRNELLTDIDKDAFALNESSLMEVYMNDNSLYALDHSLLDWSQLKTFRMDHNRFVCQCDLYNITKALPEAIVRNENGPTCVDPRNFNLVQIHHLKEDICAYESATGDSYYQIRANFTLLRIILVTLSVIVFICTFIVIGLIIIKWKKFRRTASYAFVSSGVTYNPLMTNCSHYRF